MEIYTILLLHFLLYGIPPLLIAKFIKKSKSMAIFYAYFGFLFVFTQLLASFYSIIISEQIIITGGNIAYSSMIMLTLCVAMLNNNPLIIRNLLIIEIIFNIFLFFLYVILFTVLGSDDILNIFEISPFIFQTTILVNIVSFAMFVLEILIIFSLLEKLKSVIKSHQLFLVIVPGIFIGILCVDGILFPLILNLFEPNLGIKIAGGVYGKLILGFGYSFFLILFLILYKEDIKEYLDKPFPYRYIIIPPSKNLIAQLEKVEENLEKYEMKYFKAYKDAKFYKDLFTHDMSNIIQNLSLFLEMRDIDQSKGKSLSNDYGEEFYSTFKHQVHNAQRLISNIQKLSSLNSRKKELISIDLIKTLQNAIKTTFRTFQKEQIYINIEKYSDKIMVKADELLLHAFENILNNAVKYNEEGQAKIDIQISKTKVNDISMTKIEFIDESMGISDKLKEKIFMTGFKELKGDKGMGLGLSLVSKIIESYNGNIWVENRINDDYTKGSNIIVQIPLF